MKRITRCALLFFLITFTPVALATEGAVESRDESPSTFERDITMSGYVATWQGEYESIGMGGRLRYTPIEWFGVEVFAEAFLVSWPETTRHDYPIGFNLTTPWAVTSWLQLRPLLGMCAVFSFIEPAAEHAPRADDVMFGVHGGAGVEVALSDAFSMFFDAQAHVYFGHDREVGGWTGQVSEELQATTSAQLSLGLQLHL